MVKQLCLPKYFFIRNFQDHPQYLHNFESVNVDYMNTSEYMFLTFTKKIRLTRSGSQSTDILSKIKNPLEAVK